MKKFGAILASFTLVLVLAGCGGNQNKADLRDNLSAFRNDNEMVLTLNKMESSKTSGGKTTTETLKKYFGDNPKLTLQMDRQKKIMSMSAELDMKTLKPTNFKFITDGSQFLMGAKVFGDIIKTEAGSAASYIKQSNIDKLDNAYISMDDTMTSKDTADFKKAFMNDGAWESDKKTVNHNLDELLKDVEVTKDKDGYLKATLSKKDIERFVDASEDKTKKADAKKSLKELSKLDVTLSSKGHKVMTTIKVETKDKEKSTLKFTIEGKKADVNLSMPSAKDVINTTQLQKILLGRK